MSVVFVAGIYGVGKSTLCEVYKEKNGIQYFNCSDLITQVNNEKYGRNKVVNDVMDNQTILAKQVGKIKGSFLLTGHFCILGKNMEIIDLPSSVYSKLKISKIVVLTRKPELIKKYLESRDEKEYDLKVLSDLQQREIDLSKTIASELKVDYAILDIMFNDTDYERFLKEVGNIYE